MNGEQTIWSSELVTLVLRRAFVLGPRFHIDVAATRGSGITSEEWRSAAMEAFALPAGARHLDPVRAVRNDGLSIRCEDDKSQPLLSVERSSAAAERSLKAHLEFEGASRLDGLSFPGLVLEFLSAK